MDRLSVTEFLKQALEDIPDLPDGLLEALTKAVQGTGTQVEAIKRALRESSHA